MIYHVRLPQQNLGLKVEQTEIILSSKMYFANSRNYVTYWARGSSVGIATRYGLEDPGSNTAGARFSVTIQTAFGPTQPPLQWVPGLFGGKVGRGVA
jgi:hypothetical protein